jgi:hypothetical protein
MDLLWYLQLVYRLFEKITGGATTLALAGSARVVPEARRVGEKTRLPKGLRHLHPLAPYARTGMRVICLANHAGEHPCEAP